VSIPSDHIVKNFDQELEHLRHTLAVMGGLAEAQLRSAVQALREQDGERASKVLAADAEVDELELEAEKSAVRLLALRQPMAIDLREIVAALKIASELERMGDYAANVGKRAIAISQMGVVRPVLALPRMADAVADAIHRTVDAYERRDDAAALEVWRRDEEVDEMYTALFRELLTYMMEDPRSITASTHQLFIAKNIERIGDHATNIAEVVHYLVTGERIGGRPKADRSSFQVMVSPPPRPGGAG
jgi:phosphate transport system protein